MLIRTLIVRDSDSVICDIQFVEDPGLAVHPAAPQLPEGDISALPPPPPPETYTNIPYTGNALVGDVWKGDHAEHPTQLSDYEAAVQRRLDSFAKSWGYSVGMDRAVSYVGDPNPQWNADALALRAWRSAVWVKTEDIQKHIDPKNPPTIYAVLAQLPTAPTRPTV